MKSFLENLDNYMNNLQLEMTEVSQMSGLTEQQLESLCKNGLRKDDDMRLIHQFCFNMGVDITSVFCDSGFRSLTLEDQFALLPNALKKSVSAIFLRDHIKKLGSEEQLKSRLKIQMKSSTGMMISRIISGTSSIEPHHLKTIFSVLSDLTPEAELKKGFAQIIYTRIPNYNFNEARKHFDLKYTQIADQLKITSSGVSNWGCQHCTALPYSMCKQLSVIFGIDCNMFFTQILTKEDYKYKAVLLSQSHQPSELKTKSPKSIRIKPSKTVDKKVNDVQPKIILDKLPDPIIDSDDNAQPIIDKPAIDYDNKVQPSTMNGVLVEVSNQHLMKMFNSLTETNKQKVNKMIAELFLSQL